MARLDRWLPTASAGRLSWYVRDLRLRTSVAASAPRDEGKEKGSQQAGGSYYRHPAD